MLTFLLLFMFMLEHKGMMSSFCKMGNVLDTL